MFSANDATFLEMIIVTSEMIEEIETEIVVNEEIIVAPDPDPEIVNEVSFYEIKITLVP